MGQSYPNFADLPGWTFSIRETSMCVYQVEGQHIDGRSVSRMCSDHELAGLIKEIVEDARNLPERRHAPRS